MAINLQYLYHNSILYLGEYGREPTTDDVIVGQPAGEGGGKIVLPNVNEVECVPETIRIHRNILACKLAKISESK